MNVRLIKYISFGAVGACFGALATCLWLDKKHNEQLEELYASFQNLMTEKNEKLRIATERLDIYGQAGIDFETAKLVYEKNKKAEEKVEEELKKESDEKREYVSYNDITKDYRPDEPEDDYISEEDPYMISLESFSDEHEEYRKLNCTFYTEDKILCETSHGEKIDLKHIGSECRDILENSVLDGPVYVRNDYIGADYEIDIFDGSYSYEVLGEESLEE